MFGGESWYLGVFYDGPQDMGLVTPTFTDHRQYFNIQQLLDCGVNFISMDQASPAMLALNVWTWAPNQPKNPERNNCTIIRYDSNRWETSTCTINQEYHFACQSIKDSHIWKMSDLKSMRWSDGKKACGQGYNFATPLNSYDARVLHDVVNGTIWINIMYENSEWYF
jgi:hypothetical protein